MEVHGAMQEILVKMLWGGCDQSEHSWMTVTPFTKMHHTLETHSEQALSPDRRTHNVTHWDFNSGGQNVRRALTLLSKVSNACSLLRTTNHKINTNYPDKTLLQVKTKSTQHATGKNRQDLFTYLPKQVKKKNQWLIYSIDSTEGGIRNLICLGCIRSLIFMWNCLNSEVAKWLSDATNSILNIPMETDRDGGGEIVKGRKAESGAGEGRAHSWCLLSWIHVWHVHLTYCPLCQAFQFPCLKNQCCSWVCLCLKAIAVPCCHLCFCVPEEAEVTQSFHPLCPCQQSSSVALSALLQLSQSRDTFSSHDISLPAFRRQPPTPCLDGCGSQVKN